MYIPLYPIKLERLFTAAQNGLNYRKNIFLFSISDHFLVLSNTGSLKSVLTKTITITPTIPEEPESDRRNTVSRINRYKGPGKEIQTSGNCFSGYYQGK